MQLHSEFRFCAGILFLYLHTCFDITCLLQESNVETNKEKKDSGHKEINKENMATAAAASLAAAAVKSKVRRLLNAYSGMGPRGINWGRQKLCRKSNLPEII